MGSRVSNQRVSCNALAALLTAVCACHAQDASAEARRRANIMAQMAERERRNRLRATSRLQLAQQAADQAARAAASEVASRMEGRLAEAQKMIEQLSVAHVRETTWGHHLVPTHISHVRVTLCIHRVITSAKWPLPVRKPRRLRRRRMWHTSKHSD